MKKVYFLFVILVALTFCGKAANWYNVGVDVTNLTNWWSGIGGTGTHPTSFTTAGDTWTLEANSFFGGNTGTGGNIASGTFVIGNSTPTAPGSYTTSFNFNGFSLINTTYNTLNWYIYGNLSMPGSSFYQSVYACGPCYGENTNLYLYGYLTLGATSYINTDNGTFSNRIYFANTSATISNSQLIINTSSITSLYTYIVVDSGADVQVGAGGYSNTYTTGGFVVSAGGSIIFDSTNIMGGTGAFANYGAIYTANVNGIYLSSMPFGSIQTTGTRTYNSTGTYAYTGSAPQITGNGLPTSLVTPSKLIINNPAGVTLSQSTTINGVLQFISGLLIVPTSNSLTTTGAPAGVTGAGATSYVKGKLTKNTAGYTTENFEVGDTDYAPIFITSLSASSTISVKSTYGLHPMVASSGLSSSFMANHYWTINATGVHGIPKATYNSADIIGGSNAAFLTQYYNGSTWLGTALTTTNTATPYTSAPVALVTSFLGDFIFGNNSCGTMPITGPTSVCSGSSITLADGTSGGTWSSSSTTVATISTGGIVTGIAPGTATITYSASGCLVTSVVSVVTTPVAGTLSGASTLCTSRTATVTSTVSGGIWGSSNTAVVTVNTSGVVTGIAAGSAIIVYSVTNACGNATASHSVTVYSTPTVTVSGSASIYLGITATLTATGGTTYTWVPPATLSAGTGSVVIATPTVTTTYTVTGTNISGCSNSAVVTVTVTLRPCSIPSSIISSSITPTSAVISWSAVAGATGYMLGYQAYGATSWTYLLSAGTTLTLASLISGTAYNYKVRTICGSGDSSSYSSVNTFATLVACGTPTSVSASGVTTTTATISWTAVTGAVSYILAFKTAAAPGWTTVPVAGTSYTLTGLTGATIYEYELRSVCAPADSSGYTSYSTFATLGGLPACPTPSGLTSVLTPSLAVLSWTAVPGALGYMVTYQLVTHGSPIKLFTPTNSLALSGLTLSSSYEYNVRSVCAAGDTSVASAYTTFRVITEGLTYPNSSANGEREVIIYPNPTQDKFTISYNLYEATQVTIIISNTLGQTVTVLANNELQDAGNHQATFAPMASGLYIVRMMLGNEVFTEKVVRY